MYRRKMFPPLEDSLSQTGIWMNVMSFAYDWSFEADTLLSLVEDISFICDSGKHHVDAEHQFVANTGKSSYVINGTCFVTEKLLAV